MARSLNIVPASHALWGIVHTSTRQILMCEECSFVRVYGRTKPRQNMVRRITVHYIEDHPELLLDRSDPQSIERWLAS